MPRKSRTEPRQYRRPPIEEALCEFQFKPSKPIDPALVIGKLHSEIGDEYPGPTRAQNVQQVFVNQSQTEVRSQLERIQLPDATGRRMITVGQDILAVSVLSPYPGWDEEFEGRINRALQAYIKVTKPLSVSRIGVRYINRISIPEPFADLNQYFRNANAEDKIIGLKLEHLAKRMEYVGDAGTKVILTQATIVPNSPAHTDFLLDIDVISERATPLDEALASACKLHERCGTIFEALVSEKAKESFDAE